MKVSEVKRMLRSAGCRKVDEGANHELRISPNGHKFPIKRQDSAEIGKNLLERIKKQAGIK